MARKYSEEKVLKKLWINDFREIRKEHVLQLANMADRMPAEVYKKALENGLILRPLGNVLYFNPALIITKEQLDTAIDIAYNALISVLGE